MPVNSHWDAPLSATKEEIAESSHFERLWRAKDFFLLFPLWRLPSYMRGLFPRNGEIRDGRSVRNRATKVKRATRIGIAPDARESPSGVRCKMPKEKNCQCVVCKVERSLLNSLSTQTARTHFQALARNYPILNHFDSPADVIAQLHEHERVEHVNHKAWNGILHALVDSIADGTAEEIGQQLLLLAYMPAIHTAYIEVCQQFPSLAAEDVAQQAALVLMEAARSPAMQNQNGYLPIALARDFHKRLIRWAVGEIRQSVPSEEVAAVHPEPESDENFEGAVLLEDFLSQWQRAGVLSEEECDLLRKFKWEGFEANELVGMNTGDTTNAVQMRLKRIIKRLRHCDQRDRRRRTLWMQPVKKIL